MHITFAKIYRVGCLTFEWHPWCGPQAVRRKDLEPTLRKLSLRQWAMISKFTAMGEKEREKYRVF